MDLKQKIKEVELSLDNNEKLEELKQLVANFKAKHQDDVFTKQIQHYEERVAYHTECLANKAEKEALLVEIEQLFASSSDNLIQDFKQLSQAFQQIGYAGKNVDEYLYTQLKKYQDELEERRYALQIERTQLLKAKQEAKQQIIAKAKKIVDKNHYQTGHQELLALFEEWKTIGYSGKDDDQLWKTFNDLRQNFYDKRKKYFDERHKTLATNAHQKQILIDELKALVAKEDYSDETTKVMKEFDVAWKKIGYAQDEEKLWTEFNDTKQLFWAERIKISSAKQAEFETKMTEIITRKEHQIQNLNDQILHLRSKIGSIKNDETIHKMQEWIHEKEVIIAKLEKEIANLNKKIHKA